MFIQTGFETILTPLTSQYFGWNSQANSLLFLGGGIDVSFKYLIFYILNISVCTSSNLIAQRVINT